MPIKITFKQIIQFDRKVISRNWKKINRNPITNAGVLVMLNARQSIRSGRVSKKSGKRIPSKPGRPPKSWGGKGTTPPFKQIFSVPNFSQTAVTVGMVGFGKEAIPGLHESGGTVRRQVWIEVTKFKFKHTRKTTGKFAAKTVRREKRIKTIRYPARPFMKPALERVARRGKLPPLWRNSITTSTVTSI